MVTQEVFQKEEKYSVNLKMQTKILAKINKIGPHKLKIQYFLASFSEKFTDRSSETCGKLQEDACFSCKMRAKNQQF